MKQFLVFISLLLLLSSCSNQFNKAVKSTDNEYKYKVAEQFYANKKYDFARQLYEQLFPYVKGTARFEDMYYKFAYSHYYLKDYINAENLFKTYTELFPNSAKAEECEYMRAYCFYKQSPKYPLDQTVTTKAMGLMQAFINSHPGSSRTKDATDIIDKCRQKLEQKEFTAAELYYNLGYYKAAAIAYASLMENFPDSEKSAEYKIRVIESYFKYAENSITEKQAERFEKVLSEISEFEERFQDNSYQGTLDRFKNLSNNYIKNLKNEQVKKAS